MWHYEKAPTKPFQLVAFNIPLLAGGWAGRFTAEMEFISWQLRLPISLSVLRLLCPFLSAGKGEASTTGIYIVISSKARQKRKKAPCGAFNRMKGD